MPCAKLSVESSVLFADGWRSAARCLGNTKLWGADRYGKWGIESVHFASAGDDKPVYLGTQAGFGVLAASSRIIVRDGTSLTARAIPEQSRIGDTWFEMPGEAPEAAMSHGAATVANALRECAAFEVDKAFAVRRYWPSGPKLSRLLRGIVQPVSCGGSEYCLLASELVEKFIAKGWAEGLSEVIAHCFTSEEGYQVFDRRNAAVIAWYLSALRTRKVLYRISYESLQSTRWIYVRSVADPLPPITRGACACLGALSRPVVQLTWATASWSPVVGSFFLRGA